MRRATIVTVLAVSLLFVGIAPAILPPAGMHFKGTTSATVLPGTGGQRFKDQIAFSLSHDRRSITLLTFGSLGCFGAGGPLPSKNPYTQPFATVKIRSIPVKPAGTFAKTVSGKLSGLPSKFSVTGKFSKTGKKLTAKGTLTVSQTMDQGGQTAKCGPATLTFSASQS